MSSKLEFTLEKGDESQKGACVSTARPPDDLKGKTARGALVSGLGQGSTFLLRIVSMLALARLLVPADFGLVGMVTACTGFLSLFRDAGLSMATVQRASISREQTSSLFWVNLAVGGLLASLCVAMAPVIAAFYHEPRLFWVTVVIATSFIFNGASAQHRAVLQRDMRFVALAAIDFVSVFASVVVGVWMAATGLGYWALVAMTLCVPVVGFAGVWAAGGWVPGPPRRGAGVRSMLRYGGTVTLNSVIVYLAYNIDKVLLGRFWGAEVLGIYGRAYQLSNLPTENLNTTISMVAFPALSRLQNDPERLRNYFLKGYELFLSLVMPITMACALFAADVVRVFLGAKWGEAVPVFRLLAPTILTFALINPLSWLMFATGHAGRSLRIALLIAPVVVLGYVVGLPFGPSGVAAGFSIAMVLLAIPVIHLAMRGTRIGTLDALRVGMRPLLSILIAAGVAMASQSFIQTLDIPIIRLIAASSVMFGVYAVILLFVMGQKTVYFSLMREIGLLRFAGRTPRAES
jgi:PST family polysaccharide transporter